MRRPTLCGSAATVVDECYSAPRICVDGQPTGEIFDADKEGRLSRVKRMLAGTLLIGRRGKSNNRIFGICLEELPLGRNGVPIVVTRLCGFIEDHGVKCGGHFRLSAGNPTLAERLRLSFDSTGDADLEGAGDVGTVALLLKLFLRELPEPIILRPLGKELVLIHERLHEDVIQWRKQVRELFSRLPERNGRLLDYLLRFLGRYDDHSCQHQTSDGIVTIFSPLIIQRAVQKQKGGIQQTVANSIMYRLIKECHFLLQYQIVDHSVSATDGKEVLFYNKLCAGTNKVADSPVNVLIDQPGIQKHFHQHRKRKERHESISSSQSIERKVIRSNSEERPLEEGSIDGIRRVSSHEDFTRVKHAAKKKSVVSSRHSGKGHFSEVNDTTMGHFRSNGLPLHERNICTTHVQNNSGGVKLNSNNELTVYVTEVHDDNEHERRRNNERFSQSVAPRGRRNIARRRRLGGKMVKSSPDDTDGSGSSCKENEDQEEPLIKSDQHSNPHSSSTSDDESNQSSRSSSAHSFMQLHPQERERSPSPSVSPSSPPIDLMTLHQQVEESEPLTSMPNWSFAHKNNDEPLVSSQAMMSPRNSMMLSRRGFMDPGGKSPTSNLREDIDSRLKMLAKQANSLKKKLKRFEEEFEREYGYRASHADKMGNSDAKKICVELNRIRKDIKQLKEDPVGVMTSFASQSGSPKISPPLSSPTSQSSDMNSPKSVQEVFQEVQQILEEKRNSAGRPENIDDLTKEQIQDEKLAVQKSLLYLESIVGRPATKEDRDLVRPLYDRYRTLKRLVVRTGMGKMKDSISELATILEHETMDFSSGPLPKTESLTSLNHSVSEPEVQHLDVNLHSLSLSELLTQQRTAREEKKQLRRSLREFEEDFQRRTGKKVQREDRTPLEPTYLAYKQAKAKLRLLEALLTKHS